MKQTAVEWLQDTWLNYPDLCSYDKIQEWFKQAKEMEKQQMKKAYNHERPNLLCYEKGTAFKEYYNETYKTKTIVTEFRDGSVKVETFKSE